MVPFPQGTMVFGLLCGQTPAGYRGFRPTLRTNSSRVPCFRAYPAGKLPQGTVVFGLPCGQTPAGYRGFRAYPAGKLPQGTMVFDLPCGRGARAGRAEKPQKLFRCGQLPRFAMRGCAAQLHRPHPPVGRV